MHILQKPFFNERENGMYKEGQKINVDYSVGQIINIGYYGGTHSRTLIKNTGGSYEDILGNGAYLYPHQTLLWSL